MRAGTRLGVDVGSVRVGIALCDRDGILASPLETLPRDTSRKARDVTRLALLVAEHDAIEVIVGLPTSLSGREGAAAEAARGYADAVARHVDPIGVRLVDERLSTVTAHDRLREAGVRGKRRRPVVDQVAAVVILQSALDTERMSGRPPGELVVVSQ